MRPCLISGHKLKIMDRKNAKYPGFLLLNRESYYKSVLIFLIFLLFPISISAERYIAVTIHPVSAIISEIAGDRLKVLRLIGPGLSPHTYDPLPSDMLKLKDSLGIFYISNELDGWVAVSENQKRFELMSILPEKFHLNYHDPDQDHDHGHDHNLDPHFWMDPLAVKASLPGITGALCGLDPEGCRTFVKNSEIFEKKLTQLDLKIRNLLKNARGKRFFVYHPSFRYFFQRYGILEAGVIEPAGQEASPRHISRLIGITEKLTVSAILMESQYSPAAAQMLSRQTGLPIHSVDAVGGHSGKIRYEEILLYNAEILSEAAK